MSVPATELALQAEAARRAFLDALGALTPAQRDASRLVGEWGVREIIAHLGYWTGNVTEALHHAEQGRAHEFGVQDSEVDDRNDIVARVARETDMATASKREEAAFNAMLERLRRADQDWFQLTLASGETIGHLVREDGVDHYRDHAADLRKVGGEG